MGRDIMVNERRCSEDVLFTQDANLGQTEVSRLLLAPDRLDPLLAEGAGNGPRSSAYRVAIKTEGQQCIGEPIRQRPRVELLPALKPAYCQRVEPEGCIRFASIVGVQVL